MLCKHIRPLTDKNSIEFFRPWPQLKVITGVKTWQHFILFSPVFPSMICAGCTTCRRCTILLLQLYSCLSLALQTHSTKHAVNCAGLKTRQPSIQTLMAGGVEERESSNQIVRMTAVGAWNVSVNRKIQVTAQLIEVWHTLSVFCCQINLKRNTY